MQDSLAWLSKWTTGSMLHAPHRRKPRDQLICLCGACVCNSLVIVLLASCHTTYPLLRRGVCNAKRWKVAGKVDGGWLSKNLPESVRTTISIAFVTIEHWLGWLKQWKSHALVDRMEGVNCDIMVMGCGCLGKCSKTTLIHTWRGSGKVCIKWLYEQSEFACQSCMWTRCVQVLSFFRNKSASHILTKEICTCRWL